MYRNNKERRKKQSRNNDSNSDNNYKQTKKKGQTLRSAAVFSPLLLLFFFLYTCRKTFMSFAFAFVFFFYYFSLFLKGFLTVVYASVKSWKPWVLRWERRRLCLDVRWINTKKKKKNIFSLYLPVVRSTAWKGSIDEGTTLMAVNSYYWYINSVMSLENDIDKKKKHKKG